VFNQFYIALGTTLLMGYAGVALLGWEFGDPAREVLPAEVRNSPGGYRSHGSAHFWHYGYRGGK
jgi:hypothetical protein